MKLLIRILVIAIVLGLICYFLEHKSDNSDPECNKSRDNIPCYATIQIEGRLQRIHIQGYLAPEPSR